jgi:phage regulator Rha-like protein
MFDLTTTNEVQTMNSLEIAQLLGTDHSNLKRSIGRLIGNRIIQLPPMEKVENKHSLSPNKWTDVYVFSGPEGKRDSIVVVAQNCPEFTARLVDRWQELEQKQQAPAINLNDPKQLLGLLQNYAERTLELEQKVEEAAPKVEFVDNYVDTSGLMTFREMCKFLKYTEREVRDWLVENKHMYKLNGTWAFSAEWLKAKRGEHKVTFDSMKIARISAQFTPKGFSYIVERISK